eukprot:SAG11_NODE_4993_length_1699_cov_1.009375_1_plen_47_part_10
MGAHYSHGFDYFIAAVERAYSGSGGSKQRTDTIHGLRANAMTSLSVR